MKKLLSLIAALVCLSFAKGQTDTIIKKNDSLLIAKDTLRVPESADTSSIKIDTVTRVYKTVKGVASFYSKGLDGSKTATGEIFRNKKMTAASNNFKLNSWVRVTNLSNGKTVIVRINDRMHPKMAKKGRVIDLSRLAAQKLDFIKKGLTKVTVEEVPKGTVD